LKLGLMYELSQIFAMMLCLSVTNSYAQNTDASPQPAADSAPWKIGVIMPLSGSLAAYGTSTLDGIQLMAEKINAAGGINGRQVELIIENNEGDTGKYGVEHT